jgi:hypothetical protein
VRYNQPFTPDVAPRATDSEFMTSFLGQSGIKALTWLGHQAHKVWANAGQQEPFYSYGPSEVLRPGQTMWRHLESLPVASVEAFKQGSWRCAEFLHQAPTAQYFSAFHVLYLAEGHPVSGPPIFPAAGASFQEAFEMVQTYLWLLPFP